MLNAPIEVDMNIEKRVAELVNEKIAEIERPDLFLVSVSLQSNGKLIILVDGDQGIGIGECAQISRYVGFKLEEEDVIKTAYNLEVSSPGIDTPLTQARQYTKNIGRTLAIKMADGTKREGKLNGLTEDELQVEEQIKQKGKKAEAIESIIPLHQITETKVVISFK
ncbi:ribosome maturation factor RimP [Mucilaginibacter auburnensis]|uniref:Ribosome maturation factor RimP n=2 Tax=Mucilaginibacter auburnensis TaxID=1457233 RepID=A0A2H9VSB9_9SPHI|nr:ribosome maturation factor RimP [Mucilaginibacter auburnensis]